MNSKRLNIGLVFGGRSFEHEVSLVSARAIIQKLDKNKYKIILFGIKRDGEWVTGQTAKKLLMGESRGGGLRRTQFLISNFKFQNIDKNVLRVINQVDIFFPVLHGVYGEDGTIQGFFEMMGKPYVGAGVLGSAIGMDKIIQKTIFQAHKLPTANFIWFSNLDFEKRKTKIINNIKNEIKFPCFVKPSNSGSSVGISKVKNISQLIKAIELASRYDYKILVEKAIANAREIEISVLGNERPFVSLPGEIKPSNEFYDYDAKYVDGKSSAIIPAKLDKKLIQEIQRLALKAYQVTDCQGMARIDFLLDNQRKKPYLNELNTIPGFTAISMYPKLWQASGIKFSKLLDLLIKYAISRYQQKQKLATSYQVSKNWYVASKK